MNKTDAHANEYTRKPVFVCRNCSWAHTLLQKGADGYCPVDPNMKLHR
jgi:hypothetical protein